MDCLRIDQPHHPRTLKLAHLTAWGAATWLRNPISGRACYARYATVLEPKLPAQRSVVPCGQGHHASASLPARHGTLAYAPPKRNPCPPGGHALAHTTPCGCWCEAARAHRRRTERGSVRTVLDGLTVTHGGCSVTSGVYTGVCAVGGSVVRPMGSRDAASDASESGGEAEPVAHPDAWVQCDKCTKWRRISLTQLSLSLTPSHTQLSLSLSLTHIALSLTHTSSLSLTQLSLTHTSLSLSLTTLT
jgi:hypothetical protein